MRPAHPATERARADRRAAMLGQHLRRRDGGRRRDLPALPPSIVVLLCETCGREFLHPRGHAMHRPCGAVRLELAGAQQ